jgi:two-component system, sporulation sensor kinase E
VNHVDVHVFVEEQVESIVAEVILKEGFETNSFLAETIRDFAKWTIEWVLANRPVERHEGFCALGQAMADHGYAVRQVREVLTRLRHLIFHVLRQMVDLTGHAMEERYMLLEKGMDLISHNNDELLEGYVFFRERKVEETHMHNLETVLNSIPNSILTYDDYGTVTYANSTACELMEVNKEDIVGHHCDMLLPLPGYSRSGKKIWITQESIPLADGRGSILIGYPIVRELEYYRILQAQTEFIFNAMTEGLVILDKDHMITTFNSRAERLFGIPRADVINRKGNIFLEKLQMADHLSLLHETLRTGTTFTDIQQSIRSCDGMERILKTSTRTILGEHGEILGAIGIFEDLTDRLFLEEQVRRAEKFSVLGKFAAGIAHEIRNPLTTAKGFLQLLPSDSPDPKIRQLKELVIPEIDRANEIITEFLMIAKPSAPQLKADSLSALLEDLVALVSPQALMQNVELTYKPADNIRMVALDRAQLTQVFLNLTNNAFDAMIDGGDMVIEVENCVSHVAVHFRDSGIGMDKDVIERIFEPFYTQKGHGTGLGLAVSHRIVDGHNGTIHVTSTLGAGSTFTIRLPFVG